MIGVYNYEEYDKLLSGPTVSQGQWRDELARILATWALRVMASRHMVVELKEEDTLTTTARAELHKPVVKE